MTTSSEAEAERSRRWVEGSRPCFPGRMTFPGEPPPGRPRSAPSSPSRFQPRRDFSEAALADLARSIREQGILQPIVVVPRGEGFEIIAGERRWRAARLAGLERVPITVRDHASDRDLLELALVENLQREDLNPLEAAEAYARLREEFQLTQDQIADRVGKERATVSNSLRLLKLSAVIKDRVRNGELSAGHAKALLALSSVDDQERLAEEILRRALSVRQAEKRAASMAAGRSRGAREAPGALHARRRREALQAAPDAKSASSASGGEAGSSSRLRRKKSSSASSRR